MKPNVILIHGLKFSGKSRVADRLVTQHGYQLVKLAHPLKTMLRSLLAYTGMDSAMIERCIEGDLKETPIAQLGGSTPRHAMVTLGNEWRDMVGGPTFWIDIAAARIEDILAKGGKVVVDDLRFPLELELLERFNPVTWVVTRGDAHFQPYGEDRHPSERPMSIDRFDAHIRNDYDDLAPLWTEIDALVDRFTARSIRPIQTCSDISKPVRC